MSQYYLLSMLSTNNIAFSIFICFLQLICISVAKNIYLLSSLAVITYLRIVYTFQNCSDMSPSAQRSEVKFKEKWQ
jgi:hypothetical protein